MSLRRQKSKQTSFAILLVVHFVGRRHTTMRRPVLSLLRASHGPHFSSDFERSRVHTTFDSCMKSYFFIYSSAKFVTYRRKHSSKSIWKIISEKCLDIRCR